MQKYLIVHIDDDLDDLELIGEELMKHDDIEIIQFTDAEEGLRSVLDLAKKGNQPSLILLDINIPGLNGKDALIKLRQHPVLKDIPVTLFTTSTAVLDRKFAEKHHASFVTKPVNMELLRQKIDEVVAKL